MFLEGINLDYEIIKLAIKKCNMQLDEEMLMITDEEQVNDLNEEV